MIFWLFIVSSRCRPEFIEGSTRFRNWIARHLDCALNELGYESKETAEISTLSFFPFNGILPMAV